VISMARSRQVDVDAKPEPISIDLGETALLVIDMQNDFGAKGGMFDLAGIDLSAIRSTIKPTAQILAIARSQGVPVIYVKEALSSDLSDAGPLHSPFARMSKRLQMGLEITAPTGELSRVHIDGCWNTDIIPELAPRTDELVITKRRWSAFHNTELDERLRAIGTRYLIVTGCTTSVCIESTIRDAAMRDYACLLPADCTAQPATRGVPSTHEASLQSITRSFGWVTTSQDVLRAFTAQ
jgi:ureidoacrylate peracid hydrolase